MKFCSNIQEQIVKISAEKTRILADAANRVELVINAQNSHSFTQNIL